LRDRRDGLAALLADGLLTPDAVRTQAKRLADQIGDLERQIEAATGSSPLASLVDVEDVAATFDALPVKTRREVVRTLLDVRILPAGKGIRFTPEQVELVWKGQQ
jgi:site-specific DNA recombinase